MNFIIANDDIGLSETIDTDLDLIIQIEEKPENRAFIIPYTKERHLQVIGSSDELHLTVWQKKEDKIIGFIILGGLENKNLSLELRRIVIENKNQGFGRQCLKLIKTYCFKELNFHRLWLDVFVDNLRAIDLYKSENFQIDGYLRDAIKQDNRYKTLILLSILENEYKKS